jgi:hypothetical protein
MAKAFLLSEEDRNILREIVRKTLNEMIGMNRGPIGPDREEQQSPEVYVAYTGDREEGCHDRYGEWKRVGHFGRYGHGYGVKCGRLGKRCHFGPSGEHPRASRSTNLPDSSIPRV